MRVLLIVGILATTSFGARWTPAAPAPNASSADLDHLPHGIRGLAEYPIIVVPTWLLVTITALLLALAAWSFWRWWARRQKKATPEITIHPLDQLRSEIEGLRPPQPFEGKAQEDYFFNLSMALRRFIEELLKIPATDRTLKELREPLRQRLPLSRERVADLLNFLDRADLIKFAMAPTTLDEARRCHDDVKLWIAYLMPRDLDQLTQGVSHDPSAKGMMEASHRA